MRRPILTWQGLHGTLSWRKVNAVSKHTERSVEYLVYKYRELFHEEHEYHSNSIMVIAIQLCVYVPVDIQYFS